MTAVLIPPSPQPEPTPVSGSGSGSGSGSKAAAAATGENNANAHANAQPYMYSDEPSKKIQAMVHKIQSGTEEITSQDISELDAAIKLHQKSKSAAAAASIEIPLVDKEYLKSCPSNPNVLVRYIGMVQDMLDPEYYATKVNGIHTKYREYFYREPENNNGNVNAHGLENGHGYGHDEFAMSQYLEERQPLVLVPIPNSTQFLRTSIQTMYANNNTNNNGEDVNEERMDDTKCMDTNNRDRDDGSSGRKRPLESTISQSGSEVTASRNPRLNPPQPATASENINANADSADNGGGRGCGWWPEGCMKSDPNHNPVLAKLYYDDDVHEHEHEHESGHSQAQGRGQNKPRLQLNDIVEVYGILSLDPHGASFHDQKQRNPITSGNGNCNGSTNGNGIEEISNDQYLAQQEGFFHDFVNPIAIPPPSLLPRLHVLKYNTLNLDDLIFDAVSDSGDGDGNDNGVNEESALTLALEGGLKSEGKENVNSDIDSDSERQLLIDTFAKYIFEGDKTASEALLMALLSAAERDHRYGNKAIQMPSGATLGCGSINFVLSDRESCNKLQERLRDVLTMIAPVVASVNLSLSALNGLEMNINMNSNESITSPRKNASNRLGPSVLQLPRASCLLINQAKLLEGRVNHSGERALTSLKKITTTHNVPYQFDQMEIDFEADHRVIVISSNERSASGEVGSKLLPCSMTIKLNLQGMAQDSTMDDIIPPAVISRIRRYISKCRSPHKSVAMPKVMLERSQNDFIKWRKNGLPGFGRDIEEHDFHRWLLLTRLQARSRNGAFKADLKDWKNAIRLDGDMRG